MNQQPFDGATLELIVGNEDDRPGALLPVLHAARPAFGLIPNESVVQPLVERTPG